MTPSHYAQPDYAQPSATKGPASNSPSPERSALNAGTSSEANTATSVTRDAEHLATRNNEHRIDFDDKSPTAYNCKHTVHSDNKPSTPCHNHQSINAGTESLLSCGNKQMAKFDDQSYASCDSEQWLDSRDEASIPCPYVVGFGMDAFKEEPPEPQGRNYDTVWLEDCDSQRMRMSHKQLCYGYRCRPGRILPNSPTRLKFTAVIRSGVNQGAQVVVVNDNMVAKIYDPLFYNPKHCLVDAVYTADGEYSREAAAYRYLQDYRNLSDILPTYFGSYTAQMTTTTTIEGRSTTYEYNVHMILIEYIRGRCMRDARRLALSSARQAIFKQCMDADMRLRHAGVRHGSVCPRNIILVGTDFEKPDVKVKIIDFGQSTIFYHPRYRLKNAAARLKETARKWDPLGRLPSPLCYWWHKMNGFIGWFPDKDGDDSVMEAWMWKEFGHNDRYIPCQWDPEKPKSNPKPLDKPSD